MKVSDYLRLAGLALVLLIPSLCPAAAIYDISLNTSPLIGHAASPFSLAFQFNDGSGVGDGNNTAVLSAFQYGAGGSAAGSPTLFGGASGSLTSGVTIVDNSFFNAFIQPFVPGSLLSFRLQTSTNLDAGGTPDEFSFSILDNTLTELPTNGFFDVFVVMDIDSANPVPQAFSSDPTRSPAGGGSGITMAAPLVTVASPEPGTLILFGLGLIFGMSRRIRYQR